MKLELVVKSPDYPRHCVGVHILAIVGVWVYRAHVTAVLIGGTCTAELVVCIKLLLVILPCVATVALEP